MVATYEIGSPTIRAFILFESSPRILQLTHVSIASPRRELDLVAEGSLTHPHLQSQFCQLHRIPGYSHPASLAAFNAFVLSWSHRFDSCSVSLTSTTGLAKARPTKKVVRISVAFMMLRGLDKSVGEKAKNYYRW